jgi:hypothetical protein
VKGTFHQTLVTTESVAVTLWISQANLHGSSSRGVIYCPSIRECALYLSAASAQMPRGTIRAHSGMGPANFTLPSMARLSVKVVANMADALRDCGYQYTFMAIHDPAGWPDPSVVHALLPLLRSPSGVPVQLISVGTAVKPPKEEATVSSAAPAVPVIDYAAITRSIAGLSAR